MRVKVAARVSQWKDLVLSGAFWSWGLLLHCCQILSHVSSWDTSFPTAGEGTVGGYLFFLSQFLVSQDCPLLEGTRVAFCKMFAQWGHLETC